MPAELILTVCGVNTKFNCVMQLQIFSSRGKFVRKMLLKIKTCGKLLGFIITSCMQETATV